MKFIKNNKLSLLNNYSNAGSINLVNQSEILLYIIKKSKKIRAEYKLIP